MNLPKHLGGHSGITHLDEFTIDYIRNKYDVNTMSKNMKLKYLSSVYHIQYTYMYVSIFWSKF